MIFSDHPRPLIIFIQSLNRDFFINSIVPTGKTKSEALLLKYLSHFAAVGRLALPTTVQLCTEFKKTTFGFFYFYFFMLLIIILNVVLNSPADK